jgi:P27 family predicted phage terminase small subunit
MEAREYDAGNGLVIKTQGGNLIQNPLIGMLNKSSADMHKYASDFGLSPSDRDKLFASMFEGEELSLAEEFQAAMNG